MPDSTNWTIDVDRACATCGYNLRGLQPAGLCPECGSLVSESLGNEALEWRDARWVARLRGGCALVLGGQFALVVSLVRQRGDQTDHLWIIAALALCAAGAWLVSSPARGLDRGLAFRRLRLGVRLTCAAPLAAAIAYPLATPLFWPPCIFFTFKVLGALASRRGSPSWAKYAGFVAWNLAGSMLLLGIVAAVVPFEEGAIAPVLCFLALVGPWMLAAYAGALAVLVRFTIGLRKE
jgi:hypothetical protein